MMKTPSTLVPFALFEVVYMIEHGFMRKGLILDEVCNLHKTTRVRIAHGRSDFVCRPINTHLLLKALKRAGVEDVKHEYVEGAAHSNSEPRIAHRMLEYSDELVTALEKE